MPTELETRLDDDPETRVGLELASERHPDLAVVFGARRG
jgi:hypothetical protein